MRLNKFISETGVCSRREADSWIEQGRVTVNGRTAELGTQGRLVRAAQRFLGRPRCQQQGGTKKGRAKRQGDSF